MLSRQVVRGAHKAASAAKPPSVADNVTKLSSGLTVASVDSHGPLSQLVLAFRAGSRYEQPDQAGLIHHIRCFVGRDTTDHHGLRVVWSSADCGAVVKAFATRDLFGIAMTVPRDETTQALSILGHAAAQPAFKPWELEDVLPLLRTDNAYKTISEAIFDDIHRAAYRNGSLANSVFSPNHKVGKISTDVMSAFAKKHFVTGSALLLATNIEHDRLVSYGDNHAPIEKGNASSPASSPYKGGDVRRPTGDKNAHVILAGEGADAKNLKAVAAQAVLLAYLGQSAATKFSSTPGGALARSTSTDKSVTSSAFQAVHADGGLVGVYLSADAKSIGPAVKYAAGAFKSFKSSDIDALKRKATNEVIRSMAHSDRFVLERAAKMLASSEGCLIEAISKVSPGDVEAAAKKVASKFSIACIGNVENVPYVDEL